MFGLPADAIVSYALAGAFIYYMRKHGDFLYANSANSESRTLLTLFRIYGLFGAVAAVAFLVLLWRRQSLWTGLSFVLLSFALSLVLQLLLGFVFMRRGHEKISLAGLVVVPLAIGYAFFSLVR